MLTYKIHLLRHGLTRANLEGRYIGRTDLPLCPEGRAQLEKLRDTCEYPWAERVYTSPLLRARQTAELLYPGRPLEPLDKLRELDFGAFENRTITDLEQDPAFRAWIAAPAGAAPPQGESAAALLGRAVEAVAYIFARMMEERVTWNAGPGEGYTLLLSAQMWMRDQKFEVYEQIPYPSGQGDNSDE